MKTVLSVSIPLEIVLKVIVLMRIALTVRVLKATVLMLTVIMRIVLLSKIMMIVLLGRIMMIVLLGQIINEHQASPVRVRSVGTPRATCAVLRLTNHLHIIIFIINDVVVTLLHIIPMFIISSRINCTIKSFLVAESNGDRHWKWRETLMCLKIRCYQEIKIGDLIGSDEQTVSDRRR